MDFYEMPPPTFADIFEEIASCDLTDIINDCQGNPNQANEQALLQTPTTTNETKESDLNQRKTSLSASMVDLDEFQGQYSFDVSFGPKSTTASKCATSYSHELKKWFVKINELCPVYFKCSKSPLPGTIIRALPVFKNPAQMTRIVTRCHNHSMDDNSSHVARNHLIRAEMPEKQDVRYITDPVDGRESVTVLFEPPHVGSETSTVLYKFMCNSSCPSGINRNPVVIVFTIEDSKGTVLGRNVVDIRISTCPGRDRDNEELKKNVPQGKRVKSDKRPVPSKRKKGQDLAPESKDGCFYLEVKNKENFEILKKINEGLEARQKLLEVKKENIEDNA